MNLPVEFLSGADADLQEVFNHFEDYREGFGAEFMAAILDLRQDPRRILRRLGG